MISAPALIVFLGCWIAVTVFAFIGHQNILGIVLGALLVLFGIGELVSYLRTGKTITKHFKVFRVRFPIRGWTILFLLGLGIVALILHLGC